MIAFRSTNLPANPWDWRRASLRLVLETDEFVWGLGVRWLVHRVLVSQLIIYHEADRWTWWCICWYLDRSSCTALCKTLKLNDCSNWINCWRVEIVSCDSNVQSNTKKCIAQFSTNAYFGRRSWEVGKVKQLEIMNQRLRIEDLELKIRNEEGIIMDHLKQELTTSF